MPRPRRDMPSLQIPQRLVLTCRGDAARETWLAALPDLIRHVAERWRLRVGAPFDGEEGSCAWAAPAVRADGGDAVLKLAMPHLEAEHESRALAFWNGEAAVRVLDADESALALLLERCLPGTALRARPEAEQDAVIAGLLRRLWRRPPAGRFRPLAAMLAKWADETRADAARWPDAGLVEEGLALFETLARPGEDDVLLATDLHAGNVLAARREPWLAIDPKPFVGDRTYDATQHLIDCQARLHAQPERTIRTFADALAIDPERLRLWLFARYAAESRDDWTEASTALARRLARAI